MTSAGSIPFEVTTHSHEEPFDLTEWEEITIPPAVTDAAARAIEASTMFRKHFKPTWAKDIHPDALTLASIALYAAARQQRDG
jgi:hypothetical protein